MYRYDNGTPISNFVFREDAWFGGVDRSMTMLGSDQMVSTDDLIKAQNAAIRECWVVTGNNVRQAMFKLSDKTGIYPEELEEDTLCRTMLTQKKVRA